MADSPALPSSEKQKRKKKPNFSSSEIILIEEYMADDLTRDLLRSKFTDKITNEKKKRKWEEIAEKCSSLGVSIRSGEEVCNKWQNMRKNAKAEVTRLAYFILNQYFIHKNND